LATYFVHLNARVSLNPRGLLIGNRSPIASITHVKPGIET
jgi:hypothetical protein